MVHSDVPDEEVLPTKGSDGQVGSSESFKRKKEAWLKVSDGKEARDEDEQRGTSLCDSGRSNVGGDERRIIHTLVGMTGRTTASWLERKSAIE